MSLLRRHRGSVMIEYMILISASLMIETSVLPVLTSTSLQYYHTISGALSQTLPGSAKDTSAAPGAPAATTGAGSGTIAPETPPTPPHHSDRWDRIDDMRNRESQPGKRQVRRQRRRNPERKTWLGIRQQGAKRRPVDRDRQGREEREEKMTHRRKSSADRQSVRRPETCAIYASRRFLKDGLSGFTVLPLFFRKRHVATCHPDSVRRAWAQTNDRLSRGMCFSAAQDASER